MKKLLFFIFAFMTIGLFAQPRTVNITQANNTAVNIISNYDGSHGVYYGYNCINTSGTSVLYIIIYNKPNATATDTSSILKTVIVPSGLYSQNADYLPYARNTNDTISVRCVTNGLTGTLNPDVPPKIEITFN